MIYIIQGAQFGSEGKGGVTAWLAKRLNAAYAVRTGGINAGHTVRTADDKTFKMCQLPCGFVNPNTRLVLGPGAYVSRTVLDQELRTLKDAGYGDVRRRLWIDINAGSHDAICEFQAKQTNRHHAIGATGKGVSEAISRKIMSRGNPTGDALFRNQPDVENCYQFADTAMMLNEAADDVAPILLEATQGNMLDLHLGPWPYTTGKQTCAAIWLAECGLSPRLPIRVVSVARTYPIRVAGNSGPMTDEMSWPELARVINGRLALLGREPLVPEASIAAFEESVRSAALLYEIPERSDGTDQHKWTVTERFRYRAALSEIHAAALSGLKRSSSMAYNDVCRLFEFTTVTQKLRRISHLDAEALARSITIDRPDVVFLSFFNYIFPELWGTTSVPEGGKYADYLMNISDRIGQAIAYVSTGPLEKNIVATGADVRKVLG